MSLIWALRTENRKLKRILPLRDCRLCTVGRVIYIRSVHKILHLPIQYLYRIRIITRVQCLQNQSSAETRTALFRLRWIIPRRTRTCQRSCLSWRRIRTLIVGRTARASTQLWLILKICSSPNSKRVSSKAWWSNFKIDWRSQKWKSAVKNYLSSVPLCRVMWGTLISWIRYLTIRAPSTQTKMQRARRSSSKLERIITMQANLWKGMNASVLRLWKIIRMATKKF